MVISQPGGELQVPDGFDDDRRIVGPARVVGERLMMKRGRTLTAVSMLGVLALGAGACGNDTDEKSDATTSAPTTAERTETTEATDDSVDTTTTAVSGATDEVSGTGFYGGFSFELTEAEVVANDGADPQLTISVDTENLQDSGSQVFRPPVSVEDDGGTGVSGSAESDEVPAGSSGTATFLFSSADGFDDLEDWTLLVGESAEARVELPLDGSDQVGRAPVELELSDDELSVAGLDVDFVSLEAQWSDDGFNQVGEDEVALVLTASGTNNTDGQTCLRDAVSFVGPDDDMTSASGDGDCEPVGESSKSIVFVAVVAEPETGEWNLQVAGDWGPEGSEVSGEVTFELTDEILSGTMSSDSEDSDTDDGDSDDGDSTSSGSSTTTSSSNSDDEETTTTDEETTTTKS